MGLERASPRRNDHAVWISARLEPNHKKARGLGRSDLVTQQPSKTHWNAVLAPQEYNRSANRSEAVHQVSGHCGLSAKAHDAVAACLPLFPALCHSKAPYATITGSPGHLQHHHQVAYASPSFDLSSSLSRLLSIFPSFLLQLAPHLTLLWQTREVNLEARRYSV